MSYAELNEMMNKKSGVLGLTDLSSDMRDIDRAYDEGNPRAILARDMHYGRIRRFVGEYAAEMGGVDMIVFTGGVGENSCEMRESVCTGLEFMGVEFDRAANKGAAAQTKSSPLPVRASKWPSSPPTKSGHRYSDIQSRKIIFQSTFPQL